MFWGKLNSENHFLNGWFVSLSVTSITHKLIYTETIWYSRFVSYIDATWNILWRSDKHVAPPTQGFVQISLNHIIQLFKLNNDFKYFIFISRALKRGRGVSSPLLQMYFYFNLYINYSKYLFHFFQFYLNRLLVNVNWMLPNGRKIWKF